MRTVNAINSDHRSGSVFDRYSYEEMSEVSYDEHPVRTNKKKDLWEKESGK